MCSKLSTGHGLRPRLWVFGLVFSLALHGGALVWYFWRPVPQCVVPPAAIPLEIALVGPMVAAPSVEDRPDVPDGVEQIEAVKKQVAHSIEAPTEVSEQVVEAFDTPEPTEVTVPPKVEPEPKPKPKPEKEIETPTEPQPEPQDSTELEPQPLVDSDNQHSAESTTAPASVDTAQHADQVTAPSTGMLSEHMVSARQQWQQQLHAHLAKHKQYPRQARRRNQQGRPTVQFTMTRSGQVLAVSLVSHSGADVLDQEALALIRRAEPLPKLPSELGVEQLTLTVPIDFSL